MLSGTDQAWGIGNEAVPGIRIRVFTIGFHLLRVFNGVDQRVHLGEEHNGPPVVKVNGRKKKGTENRGGIEKGEEDNGWE